MPPTLPPTLPPIGCNGRGAQASSMQAPVSLAEPSIEEQFRLVSEAGVFDNVVVVHLGTNGPFDRETLDAFLAPLSNVPNVIMINVRADRAWTASNNAILEERDTGGESHIHLQGDGAGLLVADDMQRLWHEGPSGQDRCDARNQNPQIHVSAQPIGAVACLSQARSSLRRIGSISRLMRA